MRHHGAMQKRDKPWRRRRRDVNREPAPVVYRALVWLVRVVMPLVARRHWAGQEHIPATGPAIVVGNHISNFDPLVLGVEADLLDAHEAPLLSARERELARLGGLELLGGFGTRLDLHGEVDLFGRREQ